MAELVEYTTKLQQAVDAVISPDISRVGVSRRRNGRNTLNEVINVDTSYAGGFKIIDAREFDSNGEVTKYAVKVINGADPESEYCGMTDLKYPYGNLVNVPVTELEGQDKKIYLGGRWNADDQKYEFEITTELSGWTATVEIGRWRFYKYGSENRAEIYQTWIDGNVIYFADRFFV